MEQEKCLEKYRNIINKMISKSFTNLKNKKIKIIEKDLGDISADVKMGLFSHLLRIRVHPRLKGYNKTFLEGVFSHELSHLEHFVKIGSKRYFIRYIKRSSKKYIKKDEEETDIIAIKKGYARQLYLQRKERWESTPEKFPLKKIYLSHDKIKEIAIKLGKW